MTGTTPLAPVAELADVLATVAAEATAGEEAGALTSVAVDALRRAGLFALHQPADLGGLGLSLPDACAVIAAVAAADGAAGWAVMIGSGPAWFAGHMDPEGAAEVFGPGGAVAGSGQPGRAVPVGGGGWRVTGRWRWCSGAPWAEWFTFNATDPDGDLVTVAVPAADVTVHRETWDTRGLRATASADASVDDVLVPPHRAFEVGSEARRPEPVFHVPFAAFAQATMGAVPVGIAQHAVGEAAALAVAKVPTHGDRTLAEDPSTRRAIAGAAGAVAAAEAGLDRAVRVLWNAVVDGVVPEDAAQQALGLAAVHAARTGVAVASDLGAVAGMTALARASVLGRALADLPAAARNALLSDARLAELDPRTFVARPG